MPGHGFEKVSFESADVAFSDAMFNSLDSTPHPMGHHHDPSDETIVARMQQDNEVINQFDTSRK